MAPAGEDYIQLMASLPALGPILAARYPPINRARLQARLRQLRPEHQVELQKVADLLDWSRLPLRADDREIVLRARRVIPTLASPTLAELARDQLELRTLVAALRRRQAGAEAPPSDPDWGYGRFVKRIAENWRDPGFGVVRRFPFVLRARALLEARDASGFERIVLEAAWREADRLALGHVFDFEAVALYVVRWMLLDRWTRYDAQAAAARFAALVDAALAGAPDLTEVPQPPRRGPA